MRVSSQIAVAEQAELREGAAGVAAMNAARARARLWSLSVPERQRQPAAWTFVRAIIDEYLRQSNRTSAARMHVSAPAIASRVSLDRAVSELALAIGQAAARLPIEHACYQISATYAALVPSGVRGALGMYYTPPALTKRLLDMAEGAGVDWQTVKVLDPACGGGAFLLPVALRIKRALENLPPDLRLKAVQDRLRGFEIDPFAAWMTQVWLELALHDVLAATGKRLPPLVHICDTLEQQSNGALFDLVIGNPPYGRVSLTPAQRKLFGNSLYGHANLYGVFTDIALRWAKPGGVIAYVTPTSFLAGEYFKRLRSLLATEAPPVAIDFINARRGVFDDVLQEALLATYRKGAQSNGTAVHYLAVASDVSAKVDQAGHFVLPAEPAAPWVAPRLRAHQRLVDRLADMPHRLIDWGYGVSTGPLVWNRFKTQLCAGPGKKTFPLIWAEAVATDGRFIYRANRRGHQPYFRIENGDEWLLVSVPCVLVQRTTAKEQARRLIAAEMPASFVKKYGAVVVENHLNMIRPEAKQQPKVSTAALAAVLNTSVIDEAFRCMSGSVAVSAFELEALPLPAGEDMAAIEELIHHGAQRAAIDARIRALYLPKS
jgi:adenine-specific DNA-methyltransferase